MDTMIDFLRRNEWEIAGRISAIAAKVAPHQMPLQYAHVSLKDASVTVNESDNYHDEHLLVPLRYFADDGEVDADRCLTVVLANEEARS